MDNCIARPLRRILLIAVPFAKLMAVGGPLKGTVIPLETGHTIVGRSASCGFVLDDPSVSRQHCALSEAGENWQVEDLDTRNGTYVNGVRVKTCVLHHCDQVRIGNSLFVFLIEPVSAGPPGVGGEFDSLEQTKSIVLRPEDTIYLTAGLGPAAADGGRFAKELQTLLSLSGEIHAMDDLRALQKRLLQAILEITPACCAAVLWSALEGEDSPQPFGWRRDRGQAPPPEVRRAEIDRALDERVAVLTETEGDRGAVAVLPLLVGSRPLGVIVASAEGGGQRFTDRHLQLLTAVAAISASALDHVRRLQWLENENSRLRAEVNLQHNMVGESHAMLEIFRQIARAGPAEATILILGESGTGKELVARAVHSSSPRSNRPFVAINCAALSEHLLESELFGHERGAFTGAIAQKKGKLELAEGGTVFLDEIAEMVPALQAKLLRVLQQKEFERVGGLKTLRADIRVIAATNRNIEEAVRAGAFRQDLYFRLNVISLRMPALRELREDIPLLADYFLSRFAEKSGRKISGFSPAARACLLSYHWPGNVRELENAIERAVVLGAADAIEPEDLPESVLETWSVPAAEIGPFHEMVRDAKRQIILSSLEQAGGSHQKAAQALGLNPTYLSRLIRNLDLKNLVKDTGWKTGIPD